MKPIKTTCFPSGLDRIQIEIRQFKTIYKYKGFDFITLGLLVDSIKRDNDKWSDADTAYFYHFVLQERGNTILRHYAQAVKTRTIEDMLVELSDRGVETTRLQIPCAGEGCKEVCVEEVTAPMRLDEVASEAEYVCGFKDGLCENCQRQEQRENAEEDAGRAQHEAREGQCHA